MEEETIIMAALSTLAPPQLSYLTSSVLSRTLFHRHRLSSLLASPSYFSLILHHLRTLSLPSKSLLIAKHLLSSLQLLTRHFHVSPPLPSRPSTSIKHRDLDAALLLLLLCDIHQENPEILKTPHCEWREALCRHCTADTVLMQSGIGVYYGGVIFPYIEMTIRCWRFVGLMGGCGGRKERREVAAAQAAVVALQTVQVRGGGGKDHQCTICREEMGEGRDVCELPCEHLFHWTCILPWLRCNTCPCCRFQLPTDDVFSEIQRLWSVMVRIGGGSLVGEGS